ncbi:MAG: hypothetical protein FJ271_24995 [Planctomycetes bacterium]|nr:hypothetical protein [Planctomycetota bacterium]
MRCGTFALTGSVLAMGASWALAALPFVNRNVTAPIAFAVAVEELTEHQQDVRQVLQSPTVAARGPSETFACRPEHYFHFLDHPDEAVRAWRKLGAKCVGISNLGGGQFGWSDELGSEVTWKTIYRDPGKRVWYAHGKVKPNHLLPMVPVKVVVVLHHTEKKTDGEATGIEHHAEVFLHTDSRAAALLARTMGSSTTRVAEQGLGQLQLFFSALCYYLDQNPQRAAMVMGR